jgi:hypothetical protein
LKRFFGLLSFCRRSVKNYSGQKNNLTAPALLDERISGAAPGERKHVDATTAPDVLMGDGNNIILTIEVRVERKRQ